MIYKAIIFDMDNTILDYDACEIHSREKVKELYPSDIENWQHFWQQYNIFNSKYWGGRIQMQLSREQILGYSFRDTLQHFELDVSLSNKLSTTYWDVFCNTCVFEPLAKETVEVLHGNYQLGIITNGLQDSQRKRLMSGQVHDYFETVVVSEEVGYYKPEQKIFEIALSEMNMNKEEVLFIGDSIEDDYHGSLNAEIDFCFYDRSKSDYEFDTPPRFRINELNDLLSLLKR